MLGWVVLVQPTWWFARPCRDSTDTAGLYNPGHCRKRTPALGRRQQQSQNTAGRCCWGQCPRQGAGTEPLNQCGAAQGAAARAASPAELRPSMAVMARHAYALTAKETQHCCTLTAHCRKAAAPWAHPQGSHHGPDPHSQPSITSPLPAAPERFPHPCVWVSSHRPPSSFQPPCPAQSCLWAQSSAPSSHPGRGRAPFHRADGTRRTAPSRGACKRSPGPESGHRAPCRAPGTAVPSWPGYPIHVHGALLSAPACSFQPQTWLVPSSSPGALEPAGAAEPHKSAHALAPARGPGGHQDGTRGWHRADTGGTGGTSSAAPAGPAPACQEQVGQEPVLRGH